MKWIVLIFAAFLSYQAQAAKLTRLGERSDLCQNSQGDDYTLEFNRTLVAEAQNLFSDDQLDGIVIENGDCFRVGTEVRILLEDQSIPYLGKALITKIETHNKTSLSKAKTPFTSSALRDFMNQSKSKRYSLIRFNMVEKVEETFMNTQYDRLPTCFPSHSDWRSMRLKEGEENVVKDIQKGRTIAQIWNGTFNCYKVGVRADITIPSMKGEELGGVVPTELHLVHFSHLTSRHAKLLGRSLSKLKKEMAEKQDVDGGYTTMVVFDYEKSNPSSENSP